MAKSLNSEQLIDSIKRRAFLPEDQVTFSDEDLLEIATEEIELSLIPKILQLHEDYYLQSEDVSLASGVQNYPIPYRAIGNKLRDVFFKDTSGSLYELIRIPVEHLPDYQGFDKAVTFRYYYVENNNVVIIPELQDNDTGALQFKYYISPNELVPLDRAGKIITIDTNTGQITFDVIPEHFTLALKYDIIMDKNPHKIRTFDLTPTAISLGTNQITFDPDDLPSELVVGDYVLQAQETIYPQVPVELHPLLAQYCALHCLEAMGDGQGLALAEKKLAKMEKSLGNIIDNRVEASQLKVVNRYSPIRSAVNYKKFRLRRR